VVGGNRGGVYYAMKGDEAKVVAAFCDWLRCEGWDVQTEVDYVDVVAERDGERLLCEAKGASSEVGLDVDFAYGQILRRMPEHDDPVVNYAIVVRDEPKSVSAARRVTRRVRELLRITLYAVSEDGQVRELLT
jgi:hypothetical protein